MAEEYTKQSVSQLARAALNDLKVADTVSLTSVEPWPYLGYWRVVFRDTGESRLWDNPEVLVLPTGDADFSAKVMRIDLRKKLWICPLCQRRGRIERLRDQDALHVNCKTCGDYEISGPLTHYLRACYEGRSEQVVPKLAQLSSYVQLAGGVPFISTDNWLALAEQGQ